MSDTGSGGRETLWEELSLLEDWLGGGIRREREKPEFAPLPGGDGFAATAGDNRAARAARPADPDGGSATRSGVAQPVISSEEAVARLASISRDVAACQACRLSTTRTKTVPGMGNPRPLVLVVGEGPGAEEDTSGLPFVGAAGKLLDRMLAAIGLSREANVYIANIVKCRPPGNRDPAPDEVASCLGWLEAQIETLKPRAILCLGRTAMRSLTGSEEGITRMRGRWLEYRGIPLLATFHPSALLRDESLKRPAWEDLKALRERLDALGCAAPEGGQGDA